jgi:hypothetical protein
MSAEEREKELASRTPEQRAVVERKLQEYLSLSPENREGRLRALHVRFLVRQIVRVPSSNRVDRLNALTLVDREMVQTILRDWDSLSPEQQSDVLENEWAIRVTARPPQTTVTNAPVPAQHSELEARLARWNNMPASKRKEVLDHFTRFFEELTDAERARTLNVIAEQERAEIEASLQQFAQLAPEKRERCVANLQKFADLSSTERQQFLNNATVWQQMTPKARADWRRLVMQMSLQPPMPPEPTSRMLIQPPGSGSSPALRSNAPSAGD